MTGGLADRFAPAGSAALRRAAAEGTVDDACAALDLAPDDPLATLTEQPPSLCRALAAAARERGREHHSDDERSRLRSELEAVVADVDAAGDESDALTAARRRAAAADADVDRLRERAATLRGRLAQARERTDADTGADSDVDADADTSAAEATVDALQAEFAAATRELSEAETERVAAEQALARAAERSRSVRDARERRLRLRDALANRRREARRDLARELYPAFADAVEAFRPDTERVASEDSAAADGSLTGDPLAVQSGGGPENFGGDAVVAHAAAVRVARRSDPVVVAVDRFSSPEEARERLRAPVVFVGPD